MVFTTVFFTFFYLPGTILLWLLGRFLDSKFKKTRIADIILIISSVFFFGYTNFKMISWLLVFVGEVYIFGVLIEQAENNGNKELKRKVYITGIILLIALLGYYKYSGFTITLINQIFHSSITLQKIASPLGISFLTFTAISYLADISSSKSLAGNMLDCALYLMFFPKIISGPIVLWRDFSTQISDRNYSIELLINGINRICIGFAKKIILADTFGLIISKIDSSYLSSGVDAPTALLAIILYWLQIYYDFSGYSEIAIGIANVFGFNFDNNFDFPYLSESISEFWRRWHMSLGAWFREYVYFPLGGSREGLLRTLLNLGIVFALTGIWHGAGFNYILWGFINGFFIIMERLLKNNRDWNKIPRFIKWSATTLISLVFWQLFRFPTITEALNWFSIALGKNAFPDITFTWKYFYSNSIIFYMLIGVIGATILGLKPVKDLLNHYSSKASLLFMKEIVHLILFALSIIFMINSTYSPFIYFQY